MNKDAVRISLIYAVLAGAWIVLSDRVLDLFIAPKPHEHPLQTIKGLGFVAATSISLFVLLRHTFNRRDEAHQRLSALYHLGKSLAHEVKLESIYRTIYDEVARELWDASHMLVIRHEDAAFHCDYAIANGEQVPAEVFAPIRLTHGPLHQVIQSRQPLITDLRPHRTTTEEEACFFELPHDEETIDAVYIPMIRGGKVLGVLNIQHPEEGVFTEEHLPLLQTIASQAAVAIERASLFEQVREYNLELEAQVVERTAQLYSANVRLKELDELKSKFVSDVTHELRTPIGNLKTYLHLLQHGREDKQPRYIEMLENQADRLAQLVEDILDLSRLEIQDEPPPMRSIDLNRLVMDVFETHTAIAQKAGLTIEFVPGLWTPTALGDENQLDQVIINLVANAIHYTQAGRVTLSTDFSVERDQVAVRVEDTGMGIPEEDLPHIFDRFYRGRDVKEIRGTGLGLAIVQEIVTSHQGEVVVESEIGQGSCFTIWLPAAPHTVSEKQPQLSH